jgi:hypothetical protein
MLPGNLDQWRRLVGPEKRVGESKLDDIEMI